MYFSGSVAEAVEVTSYYDMSTVLFKSEINMLTLILWCKTYYENIFGSSPRPIYIFFFGFKWIYL